MEFVKNERVKDDCQNCIDLVSTKYQVPRIQVVMMILEWSRQEDARSVGHAKTAVTGDSCKLNERLRSIG